MRRVLVVDDGRLIADTLVSILNQADLYSNLLAYAVDSGSACGLQEIADKSPLPVSYVGCWDGPGSHPSSRLAPPARLHGIESDHD
jgi:hypothetical protein